MTVDFKSIGKRVKASRKQCNMTQAELAEKTGMSDVFISRIETGDRRASLGSLIKIAIILEISLDSLVLDDSLARLPKGYREFWELLADCDINERTMILKTATAYKKALRKEIEQR
jgi:transcriptional regulator with XRE-family HTH domain